MNSPKPFTPTIISDEEQAQFDAEQKIIDDTFGRDCKFSICIESSELNDIVSSETDIIIQYKYDCWCWSNMNRPHDYFHIRSSQPHTKKSIIKELIAQDFNPICDHRFIEGFYQINKITFGMSIGS